MNKLLSLAGWLGRPLQPTPLPDIGRRELDALDTLWRHGGLTAQESLQRMQASGISLSTVQSTLERLNRKQLVSREKVGRAYVYSAAISKEAIISRLMREIADSLAGGETAPMVSGFLDYLDENADKGDAALQALRRFDQAGKT